MGKIGELTELEENLIKEIAKSVPFHISEVRDVYLRVKSIDSTIKILHLAVQNATSPYLIIGTLEIIKHTNKQLKGSV